MDKLKVTGKIHKIYDTEQISENFKKRGFVLEIESGPSYVEFPKFELIQDKVSILDNFEEGETVTVNFNLKGREWKGSFYTNLQAWYISAEKEQERGSTPPNHPPQESPESLPF